MFKSQREAKEIIQKSIDTNDKAVEKAIKMIYSRQTADEQTGMATVEHNAVGFSAFDAEILTSFAQQLIRGRQLSPKQMAIGRNKIRRYWKQLAIMSGQFPTKSAKKAA